MAKPKGLSLRGSTWWAWKDVPKPLRGITGQTSLQKTLGTSDLSEAKVRFHAVMQEFERRIQEAKRQLAGQPTDAVIVIEPRWAAQLARIEQAKPENQIRSMLEQAKLVQPKKDALSLDELFKQWKAERQPTPNTIAEYERALRLFKTLNGDLPIAEYTVAHARAWKQHVAAMTNGGGAPLAHATLEKAFGAVTTLFRFADRNDYLTIDPFAKIVLEKPKRAVVNRRQEWDRDELRNLFGSPVYTQGKPFTAAGGEATYWLPVLALYHGFRAGELCQLDKADLVQREGIACLRIRPSFEDDGAKSVKTAESEHIVPLHKEVIRLGFIEYVKTLKGAKMFPLIKPDSRGRWSGDYSKWFGRYRRSIGLDQRWTDFHSLCHGWKSVARGAEMPEDMHDEISGHDNASVDRSYGRYPIPVLKKHLDRVRFDVTIPRWKSH